jgi:hypothetical protein
MDHETRIATDSTDIDHETRIATDSTDIDHETRMRADFAEIDHGTWVARILQAWIAGRGWAPIPQARITGQRVGRGFH